MRIIYLFLILQFILLSGCSTPAIKNPYETSTSNQLETYKKIQLPFLPGTKFTISQGAFGKNSHQEPGNEYHWDFDVPYGTEVIAADSGKVIQVYEPEDSGVGCDRKFSNQVHNIKIEHHDGTIAQYSHIKSLVREGQEVKRGEKIAITSKNGFICQPQLCFGVFQSRETLWGSGLTKTIPLRFEGISDGIAKEGLTVFTPEMNQTCFILTDLATGKSEVEGGKFCEERVFACSSFKVPLALMFIDQGLIQNENTAFKWDRKERTLEAWNHDQTAKSWINSSVVWISQELTPKLGLIKIQNYLRDFKYGNQDMSGGLTQAWLSSSLKISAKEQAEFLHRLWQGKLKVSKKSKELTKNLMFVETSSIGADLFGKTGSGFGVDFRIGWYVGYVKNGSKEYSFVFNLKDTQKPLSKNFAGREVKVELIQKLKDRKIY